MTAEARASPDPGEAPRPGGSGCCEELARRISDYHDGRWRAGEGSCAEVEEHPATCPRCAELLEDYRALSGAAALAPECECTPAQIERISRGVRARIRHQVFRRRLGWTGLGLGVAAAAAVALAVATVGPSGPSGPRPDPGASGPALVGDDGPGRDGTPGREERTGRDRDEVLRRIAAEERVLPAPGVVPVGEGARPGIGRASEIGREVAPGPALLGLLLADAPAPLEGARVVGVKRGSPAEKAGLLPGDMLLKVGDEAATSPERAAELVTAAGPGASIRITYTRAGETREVEVVLAGEK